MKLFFGLGNPEKKYHNTRHNLGQMLIKNFSIKHDFSLSTKNKLQSMVGEYDGNIYAISTNYMNLSGISVQKLASYYNIPPQDIYIVHDDLDITVGEWRLQFDRGPAGHNGVKSIIQHLDSQAFWRIRIGIGHPQSDVNVPIEDYVLKPLTSEERKIILPLIDEITLEKI
ncbi:MAG TPA: aminoacyl-tRNA hydrolase [Candidatus Methanoperedens sp.]|nr:aminoacyl-tRNA hydrolase [Candidatus Methanoperedens sp.]